jgi:hypothetical protein
MFLLYIANKKAMKKILLVLIVAAAMFACEKEKETCWQCEVIETLTLSNKAYIEDTTIVNTISTFVYCGTTDGLQDKVDGIKKTETVEEYYIAGTVFYWEGQRVVTVKCIKI